MSQSPSAHQSISAGAAVSQGDAQSTNRLGVAAVRTGDPEDVRLIAKANPSFAANYKRCGHGLPSEVTQALWLPRDKCLIILKVLEAYGAKFDVHPAHSYLWLACQRQLPETVEFIEERVGTYFSPDIYPKLAIISGAAAYGNLEMLEWFMRNGSDINYQIFVCRLASWAAN